jgi:hypothetical protein
LSPTGPTLSAMAVELQVGLVREVVRVTATAVWSQGWWTIRLVGAPEINAQGATPGPGSCRHRRSPGSRSGTRRRRCAGPHPLVRRRRFDLIAGPSSRQRVWGISAAGTTVLVGSPSGVPVELLATAALSHRLPGRKGVALLGPRGLSATRMLASGLFAHGAPQTHVLGGEHHRVLTHVDHGHSAEGPLAPRGARSSGLSR